MESEKIYWSIREVRDMTHLTDSTLRYWETQFADFKQMRVRHDPQGNRHYTKENIQFIKTIKYVRDELQITRIDAIRRWLQNNGEKTDTTARVAELLHKIREDLVEIRSMI